MDKKTKKMGLESKISCAAEIFSKYGDEIRAIIHFNVKDKTKADDIYQDFFISIIRKPIPSNIQDLREYLYRSVAHDVIDATCQKKRCNDIIQKYVEYRKRFVIPEDPQNTVIQRENTKKMFHLIVSRLSKREANIFSHRYGYSWSIKDSSEKLWFKKRSVSHYFNAALQRFRIFVPNSDTNDTVELAGEAWDEPGVLDEDVFPKLKERIFKKISEEVIKLENVSNDESEILFCLMELEVSLCKLEEEARAANRTYETKLAASLRDICRVHEPSRISEEQIKYFVDSVRDLMEGWGELNREKLRTIRGRLLGIGLTWLPVTDKAASDVSDKQNS